MNRLASSANSQGVSFYTIDASGLDRRYRSLGRTCAADRSNGCEHPPDQLPGTAARLAEKTGGRAIVDSNDATGLLEEMRDDLFTYYSLGYTLSSSGSDTVHKIEVELPDIRSTISSTDAPWSRNRLKPRSRTVW